MPHIPERLAIPETASEITRGHLAQLIQDRDVSNAELARALGVEGWTVGAWLSGKREISEKYKEEILTLLKVPANQDLFIGPATYKLTEFYNEANFSKNHNRRQVIQSSLASILAEAGHLFARSERASISPAELRAVDDLFFGYDDVSVANVLSILSNQITERIRINNLPTEEFVTECSRLFDAHINKIRRLYEHEISSKRHIQLNGQLVEYIFTENVDLDAELKFQHEEIRKVFDEHKKTNEGFNEFARQHLIKNCLNATLEEIGFELECTHFKPNLTKSGWTAEDTLTAVFEIPLNHPKLRDSLRILLSEWSVFSKTLAAEYEQ